MVGSSSSILPVYPSALAGYSVLSAPLLDNLTTAAADRISAQNQLIAELQSAVAAGDQRTAEALAAQLTSHTAAMEQVADRLRAVATDPDDVVPDPSPLPEVPVDAPVDEEAPAEEEPAAPVDEFEETPTEEPASPVVDETTPDNQQPR